MKYFQHCSSGFYADEFLKYFEQRELNYIVPVKLFKPIEQMLEGLSGWINLKVLCLNWKWTFVKFNYV